MARGPAQEWTKRKPPITDDYILAAVNQAGGLGKHDAGGYYPELVIKGLATRDEAEEYRASLWRCAFYLHRKGIAPVSMTSVKIERDGDGYRIRFKVSDKTHARARHLARHGTDRTKWPYDPTRRNKR